MSEDITSPDILEDEGGPPVLARAPNPLRALPTPLHMKSSQACQTNEWTTWAGYTVPDLCTTPAREMKAITKGATLCDISPESKYVVWGPHAEFFLDHLVVGQVGAMGEGEVLVTPMCQASGKVVDIITLARLSGTVWWFSCPGRHMNWLEQTAAEYDISLEDYSHSHAGLALSGPAVSGVLLAADLGDCTDLVLRGARHISWDGIDAALINRPGEAVPGLSLWCPAREAPLAWKRLLEAGEASAIEVVGLKTRQTLRVESGQVEQGRDFVSAPRALRADQTRSALELGFGHQLEFDKGVFNGRAALLEESKQKPRARLAQFEFTGPAPQVGSLVYKKMGRKTVAVGRLTSITSAAHRPGTRALGFVLTARVRVGDSVQSEPAHQQVSGTSGLIGRVLSIAD